MNANITNIGVTLSSVKGQIWFLTGSQNLYGEDTLKQVADQSKQVVEQLKAGTSAPVEYIWKPVVKTSDEIKDVLLEASS